FFVCRPVPFLLFFFYDTATSEIYTLSLHDALPISGRACIRHRWPDLRLRPRHPRGRPWPLAAVQHRPRHPDVCAGGVSGDSGPRSEEHTSELQSRENLVCRLLLEKKKIIY